MSRYETSPQLVWMVEPPYHSGLLSIGSIHHMHQNNLSRDNPGLFMEYETLFSGPSINIEKVCAVGKKLKLSGFEAESEICFQYMVKWVKAAAALGKVDSCLEAERLTYQAFIQTTETEEHYYSCFRNWDKVVQQLGRQQQQPFVTPTDPKKICFITIYGAMLAHTEVMLKTVDVWISLGVDVDVSMIALGGYDDDFKRHLDRRNIRIVEVFPHEGPKPGISKRLLNARDRLCELGVRTAIWLSVPPFANYALAMKLAPRQVFWSLKFHAIYVPEADLHVCDGHESEEFRIYNGNTWAVSPFPLTVALSDNSAEEISAFRNQFPKDALLLGTLAREEKIDSEEFLSAVCRILVRNPQAHYLWTGRQAPPRVTSAFEQAGIADRCHFIGWVNTNLVAEALDIFLDTFPFGCGLTGFQAMGHGTPLLSLFGSGTLFGIRLFGSKKAEALGPKPAREATEALDILTAVDIQHYVELAQLLIDSPTFRSDIGKREQAYYRAENDALPRYAKRLLKNLAGLDSSPG